MKWAQLIIIIINYFFSKELTTNPIIDKAINTIMNVNVKGNEVNNKSNWVVKASKTSPKIVVKLVSIVKSIIPKIDPIVVPKTNKKLAMIIAIKIILII